MTITPLPASIVRDRRRLLTLIALLLALGEYVDAFFISFPAGAAGFATLLLVGALWTRRPGIGGPILLAALFAFEDANAPFWPHTGIRGWIVASAYAAVALAGLLVASGVLKRAFDARGTGSIAPRVEA